MARYWAGQPRWVSNPSLPQGGFYAAPAGVLGWFDLRTSAECAVPNSPSGVALFVTANATDLGAGFDNLGTDLQRVLTDAQRDALATRLRLTETPPSNVLGEVLYFAVTGGADPDGILRAAPILPTRNLRIEIWLANQKIADRPFRFDGPEAPKIKTRLQKIYKRIRDAVVAGNLPENHHRKWLGYQVRKYRTSDYRWFQSEDVPDETPVEPTTEIADSFDRTNDTDLNASNTGKTLDGGAGTWQWGAVNNSLQIVSNAVRPEASPARERAEHSLSSDDHYCQISVPSGTGTNTRYAAAIARYSDAADDCYLVQAIRQGGADQQQFAKIVGGTLTALGTPNNAVIVATHKIECEGDTLTRYHDGVEQESITDTAWQSWTNPLRAGLGILGSTAANSPNADDFAAGDLAAPPAGSLLLRLQTEGLFVGGLA